MMTNAEIADRLPFAGVALTGGGVLAEESLKLFK
jgi:hypothetical protein